MNTRAAMGALMPIRVSGDLPPLFCVHGEPLRIAQHVSANRPVYALNYVYAPENLQRIPDSLEKLAAIYIQEIRAVQPEGPYYLFGFSVGAVIAYEMARQMESAGILVAHLLLAEPILMPTNGIQKLRLIWKHGSSNGFGTIHLAAAAKVLSNMVTRRPAALRRRLVSWWRKLNNKPLPDRIVWLKYLAHIKPFVRKYRCVHLDCPMDIVYRGDDADFYSDVEKFWLTELYNNATIHRVPEADRHLDLMESTSLAQMARIIDASLSSPQGEVLSR